MHTQRWLLGSLLALTSPVALAAPSATLTVNNAGDSGDGTCTTVCTLRDAVANVAAGGTILFDAAILPATITLQQGTIYSGKSMRIQGPGAGKLAVSAASSSRLFTLSGGSGVVVAIAELTLRDGAVVGSNGGDGSAGSGGVGQLGESARGGCLYVVIGKLLLERVSMRNCSVQGGAGGHGGSGTTGTGLSTGGQGGGGGGGGSASGGAISIDDLAELVLIETSIIDAHAIAGNGGDGGDGGSGFFRGKGGAGGDGGLAVGGAVHYFGKTLSLTNTTLARSSTHGGDGGDGGLGDAALATANGGNGGRGGNAYGGLLSALPVPGSQDSVLRLDFTTAAEGEVAPGSPGAGGAAAVPGSGGQAGDADGAALSANTPTALRSTAVFGSSAFALCNGVYEEETGVDQDGTCAITLHAPMAAVLRPISETWPLPGYMPVYAGAAIDSAASCNDSNLLPVLEDGRATARPQGPSCDIGAIEADYIFVGNFD